MNDARHNIRERVRESGSSTNTKICFEIRAHSSTSPPSHRRISTNSSTQDFPHRDPPLRILGKYNREYTTPLSTNTTSLQRQGTNKSPLHLEGQALSQTNNSHLTLEGFQHNLHLSLEVAKYHFHNHLSLEGYQLNYLSLEGYHNQWKVYNLVVYLNHKPILFSLNKDPNRQDSR